MAILITVGMTPGITIPSTTILGTMAIVRIVRGDGMAAGAATMDGMTHGTTDVAGAITAVPIIMVTIVIAPTMEVVVARRWVEGVPTVETPMAWAVEPHVDSTGLAAVAEVMITMAVVVLLPHVPVLIRV